MKFYEKNLEIREVKNRQIDLFAEEQIQFQLSLELLTLEGFELFSCDVTKETATFIRLRDGYWINVVNFNGITNDKEFAEYITDKLEFYGA